MSEFWFLNGLGIKVFAYLCIWKVKMPSAVCDEEKIVV
jgi:hypothetical protein